MKTINLLSLANSTITRTEKDGAVFEAANGIKLTFGPVQFLALQVWLREINKRKLPRRLAVGNTLFTLDNVDQTKPELYEVQYKMAVESIRLPKGEAINFTPFEYDGKHYLQMDETPYAFHVADDVVEAVLAFGVVATPSVLEVSDDPMKDFSSVFSTLMGDFDINTNITVVMRKIPVMNAQVTVMSLAESMKTHPEMTAKELVEKEEAEAKAKETARNEAMKPYRGFLDAIFECANSMLHEVQMPAEKEAEPKAA
ncbi:hypothetical protein pEaSNUABM29_00106 [Erwinia phage pEa_SNUABM_29]|nr:hypothetical protein pEaSNUABM29_00106 [Erwinia phage pEa_SNUABM_29]